MQGAVLCPSVLDFLGIRFSTTARFGAATPRATQAGWIVYMTTPGLIVFRKGNKCGTRKKMQ